MHVLIHYFPEEDFFVASVTKHTNLNFIRQQKRWKGLRFEYIATVLPKDISPEEFQQSIVKYFGHYKAKCLPFRYAFKSDVEPIDAFVAKYQEVQF